jgi:hypothetical protein
VFGTWVRDWGAGRLVFHSADCLIHRRGIVGVGVGVGVGADAGSGLSLINLSQYAEPRRRFFTPCVHQGVVF